MFSSFCMIPLGCGSTPGDLALATKDKCVSMEHSVYLSLSLQTPHHTTHKIYATRIGKCTKATLAGLNTII